MQSSDIEDVLGEISIFGGIERQYVDRIIPHCEQVHRKAGELLYHENDPATEIFIVIRGKIKLVLNYETNPMELIELIPGCSLGETSVIGIQPHGSTAVVTEDVTLLVLSRIILDTIHTREPEVFTVLILNIARELARRLHRNRKTLHAIKQAYTTEHR